jgi:hypothetical protein
MSRTARTSALDKLMVEKSAQIFPGRRCESSQQTLRAAVTPAGRRSHPEAQQLLGSDQALVPGGKLTTFDWMPKPRPGNSAHS